MCGKKKKFSEIPSFTDCQLKLVPKEINLNAVDNLCHPSSHLFYTTRPDIFNVNVMCSAVKSDHKAVIVNCDTGSDVINLGIKSTNGSPESVRTRHIVYELSPDNLSVLSNALVDYNWSGITLALEECHSCTDFSSICSDFIKVVKYLIHTHLPSKAVTFSNREPSFITP